jgi:squalene-hopene/tetraprenyl-beta-curcumene cyclase
MAPLSRERLAAAYEIAKAALLAERHPGGYWLGELSSSALSTATTVSALSLVGGHAEMVRGGLRWLSEHQNADGGWGDTVKSLSNISTTMLGRAACRIAGAPPEFTTAFARADEFMAKRWGATPTEQAEAIRQRYGKDRTFSVPILMNAALAGLVDWAEVPALPFELACLPQSWYRFAGLPVVSYALPALIAIGQAIHHYRPSRNPVARLMRRLSINRSLRVLERIQPASGGYLEAAPLTSFVVMALSSSPSRKQGSAQRVIDSGVRFLLESVRPDGSWPIDTNLSVWVTTLAINALAAANDLDSLPEHDKTLAWILDQQETEFHPYTGAWPGGWGWSHLSGSVPDADDTPGALMAIVHLDDARRFPMSAHLHGGMSGPRGLEWLLGIQNTDGGWPTFCRGWTGLPFDRSGADLTAHVLRALSAWRPQLNLPKEFAEEQIRQRYDMSKFCEWAIRRAVCVASAQQLGLKYLARQQRPDGSWLPLWFGNQHAPDDINPTYGTARVLAAYRDLGLANDPAAVRGVRWLLDNQNDDGGWGGGRGTPSSVEETALAVEVLLDLAPGDERVQRGLTWLVERVESGGLYDPTPIGFYFAKLWYFEKMYPIVFSVAALGRALRVTS